MAGNTFGEFFKITTFGESHGEQIGVVIDGCPAGLTIDFPFIQNELNRRKPGQSKITTPRHESDQVSFISGIFEGKSTGTPICGLIQNQNHRSQDYAHLKDQLRPSHADFTYEAKYGHRDPRGSGRASARETASRVIAGAIAKLILQTAGIQIFAFVSQVGRVQLEKSYQELDLSLIEENIIRCPDPTTAHTMLQAIEEVRLTGDTLGGVVTGVIRNCPAGLGEPVFDRLQADLAKAMLSINAAKGFEYGSGFSGSQMKGSEHNDPFYSANGQIKTKTNYSGGIQGGISNGMDIYFNVAFKPVSSLHQPQTSCNTKGELTILEGLGRHDPCVVPRAVPIVEAMAAITLVDHWLRQRCSKLK